MDTSGARGAKGCSRHVCARRSRGPQMVRKQLQPTSPVPMPSLPPPSPPNPPVIRFPPLPLGHLTLGTGSDNFSDCCRVTGDGGTLVGNSLASAPSEVASQESPVRHTSGKCQPDTMENKKEGLGRAALTPLRAGGIELNGEGGQG